MIYLRSPQNQSRHDISVSQLANQLVSLGWSVRSDLPFHIKPPIIQGYIPDIYAVRNGVVYIIEVETADSVNTMHALRQKSIFQSRATLLNGKFEVKVA